MNRKGAGLSNIPDYQTVSILPKYLQVTFRYCFYIWDAQLIKGVLLLDISVSCWFRSVRGPFLFLLVSSVPNTGTEMPGDTASEIPRWSTYKLSEASSDYFQF